MLSDAEFQRRLDALAKSERAEVSQSADPRFSETHIGPTPSGGDYSVAYFYDNEHRPCIKSDAHFINIVEYNNAGERINEAYGIVDE